MSSELNDELGLLEKCLIGECPRNYNQIKEELESKGYDITKIDECFEGFRKTINTHFADGSFLRTGMRYGKK